MKLIRLKYFLFRPIFKNINTISETSTLEVSFPNRISAVSKIDPVLNQTESSVLKFELIYKQRIMRKYDF